jgi:hypothetical protein
MAAEQLIQDVAGSSLDQIRFCIAGSFSPADSGTDWTIGTPTDVALTLASLAAGSGRQSAKVDLGAVRAEEYALFGCVDFTGETITTPGNIAYYWAPSTHTTAGNGNVAGNSGADAAAPDGALGSITLAEFLDLCEPIGKLILHDGGAVQNGFVGIFRPPSRYGQLIVVNNCDSAIEADDVENHQVLNPIVPESQ